MAALLQESPSSQIRSWSGFFSAKNLKVPTTQEQFLERATSNLQYFQFNYAIFVVGCLALVLYVFFALSLFPLSVSCNALFLDSMHLCTG